MSYNTLTMVKKEIGGYFALELREGREYHETAIPLYNSRSALQYLLRAKKYRKIYLPHYICGCVLQPIIAEKVEYEWYYIDDNFFPIFDKKIANDECFLYVNYFGLNDKNVHILSKEISNLIIDNTQAFYSLPESGVDTIYSARKFFGVPDGGYLYTDIKLNEPVEKSISYHSMGPLLKRIEFSANSAYEEHCNNERLMDNQGIKSMSNLTHRILRSIDYDAVRNKRRDNFNYIHELLKETNMYCMPELGNQVPMLYPYLCEKNDGLREKLISEKIYTSTFWIDVLNHLSSSHTHEENYINNMLILPIDQRYNHADMDLIYNVIKN